ncbi:pyridoxamine 5'-phosphate oxidase family protein [Bifidobacterium pseudocatenulatum]
MRRADREVTEPQQIDAIIATCKIVSLAYTDAEGITIVPLNFGYVFDAESNHLTLYFHGSATGRKMDAVKAANNGASRGVRNGDRLRGGRRTYVVQLGRGVQVDRRQWHRIHHRRS